MELSAVEYRLLCQLAGEPTRVLTKVNSDGASPPESSERGIRVLGAGLVIPSPGEALAGYLPRASRIGRYGEDLAGRAGAHLRGRINDASAATASRPTGLGSVDEAVA
jgi:hypothetical protein